MEATPIIAICPSCGRVHEFTHPIYVHKLRIMALFCHCGELLACPDENNSVVEENIGGCNEEAYASGINEAL
jgi:hypothetical protein